MEKTGYAQVKYATPPSEGSILQLPIEQIYAQKGANTGLKRNESIRLARNIEKYGISTPIVVTPVEAFPGFYRYRVQKGVEIWHAACIAGAKTLPCVIESAPAADPEAAEILAQIHRGSLHIFDQAHAIRHLIEKHGLTRAEIAKETGFSSSAIANKLRLCRLSSAEQQEILRSGLTERHARAILRLRDPQKRLVALQVIREKKMSVAASESLVEAILADIKGDENTESPLRDAQTIEKSPLQEEDMSLPTAESASFGTESGAAFPATADTPLDSPISVPCARKIPVTKPITGSICPKKFALHTLQPLYNSIERTLSIFRKTGRDAEMRTLEGEDAVLITIRIPTTG